ncbi:MAG: phosphoribosylanthranilate isomerase [Kiloniellaceae bacterium]
MTIEVKICGVNTLEAAHAAVGAGADYIGLVFYPPSPRAVTPAEAGAIARALPAGVRKVGLFVDAGDALIAEALGAVGLDLLQFHGSEAPARVAQVRARFGVPVMKAIKVAGASDVAGADAYLKVADRLLFDAKAPEDMPGALPGGNALAFDWRLLAGRSWPLPWMLSGGLDPANVAEAARVCGAPAVDVSSGVEDRPGVKNLGKIRAFVAAAKGC